MAANWITGKRAAKVGHRRLCLIVSCADRKRLNPPDKLRMRSIRWQGVRPTSQLWVRRLEQTSAPVNAAKTLYAGDHWSVAMGLGSIAASLGLELDLWVVSAGYGLVSPNVELKPYSAAFSPGQPDSIAPSLVGRVRDEALRGWWKALTDWPGPSDGIRSLAALARVGRRDPMLVALSVPYLRAVNDDLIAARESLSDPHLLQVICAGAHSARGLSDNLLPVNGRLRSAVGGPLVSLNVRIARWIIDSFESHQFVLERLRSLLLDLNSSASTGRERLRRRLTDAEIVAFVRRRIRTNSGASRTQLLRDLRSQGLACEQGRFGRLFEVAVRRA